MSCCQIQEQRINVLTSELELLNGSHVMQKILPRLFDERGVPWSARTEKYCWWCCHSFFSIPVGIPVRIHLGNYYLSGNFCGFSCCHAYLKKQNSHGHDVYIVHLKQLFSEVSSAQLTTALSPTAIISFGGGLTIAEFRGGAQDAYRKH